MAINDGGPAFPCMMDDVNEHGRDGEFKPRPGQSLRDYFAAHVTAKEIDDIVGDTLASASDFVGVIAGDYRPRVHLPIAVAKARYMVADAMLAARDAKGASNG
jgi:hypothetical protein